jgi:hypothetical protein
LHLYSTSGDTKLIIESDGDNNNEGDNAFIIFRQDGSVEQSAIWNGNWTGSNDNQLILANASGVGGGIIFATGSDVGYTTADEAMRITPSGNLGINSTTPTEKLDVVGTVKATLFSGSGASLTSIPNGALDNSTVSYGGVTLSLGGSDATPAFNLADATGLPISTGVSGLGANVATFLTTPSSANLRSAVTDETGSGALVFATSPTLVSPTLGNATATTINVSGVSTFQDNVSIAGTVGIGTRIDIVPYDTLSDGTLSFEGSAGQLFSITNNLTSGSIFSVNDVSGIPSIDVDADGTVLIAPYGSTEYVGIGTTNPTAKLDVNGTVKASIFESTVASGTAPFVVASTTQVTNLNANYLNGYASDTTNTANRVVRRDASGNFSAGTITATLFSGSGASLTNIPNGALDNSTVSYGGVQLSLGGSDATPAFNLQDATNYPYASLTGITTSIVGDTTPQLGGDLDLNSNNITGTGNIDITGSLNVSGVSTFQSNVNLGDNDKIEFWVLVVIYRFIIRELEVIITDVGTGNLRIGGSSVTIENVNNTANQAVFISGAEVSLYYNNSKKFETTADGILVDPNVGLGTVQGNSQDLAVFQTTVTNNSLLRIVEARDENGSDWTSTYTRIQKTIDVTNQAYIQFNGADNTYGMEFGTNADEKFAQFIRNGSVEFYYDNSKKFETTGIGVSIVGTGNTATITGPSNLVLDPAAVGDATGTVTILGNLQVDGTQTIINSTTMTVDDLNITLASGAANAAAANGAGLTVDGASATLTYSSTGDSWVFNKAPYYNTNKILTTADEGTGNGLDADTLDTLEASSFLRSDAADTATGAITFSGGQTWNSHITWNASQNITIAGESSFDIGSGGTWQVWDASTSNNWITASYGQPLVLNSNALTTIVNTSNSIDYFRVRHRSDTDITMDFYCESNTTQVADTFSGTTDKKYITFSAPNSSNDSGFIMHETRGGESNEGVLHLCPSDDNAEGDYVSIHGTNDADRLRLHTSGLIETANVQLELRSGSSGIYLNDNVGINTTTPGSTLAVGGTITELYDGTYWNVVTQADVGYGASQVPLNQYLGQLAFLDDFSPNGLRRDGGGEDDVVVDVNGNVGVGTTNPTSRFTVVGDANISGVATVGFLTATNIWNAGITTSSRLTLNGANSTTSGGGQIYLNGAEW